jgi:hypothetical protein
MSDEQKPKWRHSSAFGQIVDDTANEPVLWADGSDLNCDGKTMAAIVAIPEMLAMLERLEWCACIGIDWQEGSGAILGCECCQMEKADGHQPDCELAALLKRARGEA